MPKPKLLHPNRTFIIHCEVITHSQHETVPDQGAPKNPAPYETSQRVVFTNWDYIFVPRKSHKRHPTRSRYSFEQRNNNKAYSVTAQLSVVKCTVRVLILVDDVSAAIEKLLFAVAEETIVSGAQSSVSSLVLRNRSRQFLALVDTFVC